MTTLERIICVGCLAIGMYSMIAAPHNDNTLQAIVGCFAFGWGMFPLTKERP